MNDFLMAVGIAFAVVVAAGLTGFALILRALARANRVVAGRRSAAPLGWLWSWRQAPRLHRRLRRVAHVAQDAVASVGHPVPARRAAPSTPLHEVAAELTGRAALVDDRLVAASRPHRHAGRRQLAELSAEVRDLEDSAYRLQDLSAQWRFSLDRAVQAKTVAPPDLRERMDALEAALLELPTSV